MYGTHGGTYKAYKVPTYKGTMYILGEVPTYRTVVYGPYYIGI